MTSTRALQRALLALLALLPLLVLGLTACGDDEPGAAAAQAGSAEQTASDDTADGDADSDAPVEDDVGEGRGIEPLAWADGAPSEAIAALDPDLIFVPDADTAKLLDDIAPTVPAGAANGHEWKGDFRYIADVLGRSDDADTLLADYETEAAELAEELEPVVDGRTVASPQVAFDHTQVYLDNSESFSSAVLEELGLDLAPVVTDATEVPIAISFERLTEIDADILFWQIRQRGEDGNRDTAGFQVLQDSPLWHSVPAVAAGSVYEVDNRPWYFPTILAAHQMLIDVEAALL